MKLSLYLSCGMFSNCDGFRFGSKGANVLTIDGHYPPLVLLMYTSITRSIVAVQALVSGLLRSCRWTQFAPAIITRITIAVVNGFCGFFTSHHFPNDTMGVVHDAINTNSNISFVEPTCRCARPAGNCSLPHSNVSVMTLWTTLPRQHSGSAIISETLAQVRHGWQKLWFGHRTGSYGSGSSDGAVLSALPRRAFYLIQGV